MKLSKYTFLFDVEGREFYAYNTLSNALIEIDGDSYVLLSGATPTSDLGTAPADASTTPSCVATIDGRSLDEELYEALCANNILTDSDEDDYLKYKAYITRLRSQRTSMHLTLAPTMDCCFRCHYCFEKYKDKNYMSEQVMETIVKYVTSFPDLQTINITWFGGEPLMAVPQMEAFYDKFSAAWSKSVVSNIITTGYHIDHEAIRVLKKIGVTSAQITLDGIKETHNKVKHLPGGEDVFEEVLGNIELLNDLAPEINIVIRVNLTRENAHEYIELHKLFLERFKGRKNMGIAPAFVLDRGASNCDACVKESVLFAHRDRSEYILDLAHRGIDSPYLRYPERFFNECAIRNDMAVSFDPEGYAYKCWEVIGNKEYAIGRLNAEGRLIDTNERNLNRQLFGADTIDDPTCSQCKYLPVCNGGCPIQRLENKFEHGHNNTCTFYKGFLPDFLTVHLIRKKAAQQAAETKTQ